MADYSDQYTFRADTADAERAERRIAELEMRTKELHRAFHAGRLGADEFVAGMNRLATEAGRAEAALHRVAAAQRQAGGGRLTGAERGQAASLLGFGAANMAQDVIQGGNPAYALNNALFLAQQRDAMRLLGEMAPKLGAIGIAAGAAFLTIREGLESAKLQWSDLDDVIGNLAPIEAFKTALAGVGEVARNLGISQAVVDSWTSLKGAINAVADYALGWNAAADAARAHKEEVAQAAAMTRQAEEAGKRLGQFQSEEQRKSAERGKLVGGALADLGGKGGIEGLIGNLAQTMAGSEGASKVTIGGETRTQREWIAGDLRRRFDAATRGDQGALAELMPMLGQYGYDTSKLGDADAGRDIGQEKADLKHAVDRDIRATLARVRTSEDADAAMGRLAQHMHASAVMLQQGQFTQREYQAAMEKLTDASVQVAEARRRLADAELTAQGLENEGNAPEEARRLNAAREDRVGRLADARMGRFGGALMAAMGRGVSDDKLQEQLAGRLTGVPEALRRDVARSMVESARGRFSANEDRMALLRETYGPLADPRVMQRVMAGGGMGRGGIMASQFRAKRIRFERQQIARIQAARQRDIAGQEKALRRAGIDPATLRARTQPPGAGPGGRGNRAEQVADKQEKSIDRFVQAVDKLTSDGLTIRCNT